MHGLRQTGSRNATLGQGQRQTGPARISVLDLAHVFVIGLDDCRALLVHVLVHTNLSFYMVTENREVIS